MAVAAASRMALTQTRMTLSGPLSFFVPHVCPAEFPRGPLFDLPLRSLRLARRLRL